MRKPVYDTILAQVKAALEGKKPEGDLSLFKDVRGNKITFSLKTYKTPRGLATDLFSSKDASYQIKGPMGSGLAMKKGGVHVAFCGGTGLFVYIDLVTHLARRMMGLLSPVELEMVQDDFKFILYASFPSRDRAIAIDFLDSVHKLSLKTGKNLFEVRWRISSETKQRWDKPFILQALKDLKKVERLWVCGPPPMNEEFEKILAAHHAELGMEFSDYDVM